MTSTYVVGAAMIPMGKHQQSSYAGLAIPAVLGACEDAGISMKDIGAVFCGHAFGGMLTAQRICKGLGIGGVPITNVDNACSGGATALRLGVQAIESGECDIALVIGVDKLTQFGGGTLPLVAEDIEVQQGIVMPALYAMRARRHMHEYGTQPEDLAAVAVKARRHGTLNPFAQLKKETTVAEVLASRPIADPLTLFQCCPTGDGAAAVIVMSDKARKTRNVSGAMRVAASVLHSGQMESGFRNMLRPEITCDSAREAYEQSALGPQDLDMIELHDAFSIAELIYYEALGLCGEGEAVGLLHSGATTFGGKFVVNPSGGLLAKGHPVGASGVAQIVEAFWQLTGRAGARQVTDARIAMTHVTGGGIAGLDHGACCIHIFEKS